MTENPPEHDKYNCDECRANMTDGFLTPTNTPLPDNKNQPPMEKETPEENLNQACVRVLKEMTKETLDQAQQKYCPYHGKKVPCGACQDLMDKTYKETPECCTDTCGKERPNWLGRIPITPDPETPEHDKYNCEECRENMREYTKETPKIGDDPTAFSTPTAPGVIIRTAGTSSPETPTEEWEKEKWVEQIVEDVLLFEGSAYEISHKEVVKSERDRLREIVLAELRSDIELTIFQLLTSHDAELRRKIEGMKEAIGKCDCPSWGEGCEHYAKEVVFDAVLALFTNKKEV